ncbi:hypothetical protein EHV15_05005 [Paenibacillus oralis]|uniref:Uncharacterized protein n=1 Tax=Paenibacillus oralis TaxID=2490856 RepID=A0A3P3TYM2_9BACL|nr:hypothetical protein [Paenibacillus oralis]RRJ62378.1 hypothetical protein EHV15_05005 [Paenibacillus oralis]
MLIKWLEPVIEASCDEINNDLLNNEDKEMYENVMRIVKENKHLSQDDVFEIENYFLLAIRNAVVVSYTSGLRDGINIYRK